MANHSERVFLLQYPYPEIKMYAHPDARLRFVVDARRLDQDLPCCETKGLGEAGALGGFHL